MRAKARAIVCVLCGTLSGIAVLLPRSTLSADAQPRRQAHRWRRLIAAIHQGALGDLDHPSPDGRYIAREVDNGPGYAVLAIIDLRSHRQRAVRQSADSYLWVPHHPHSLVVAEWFPGFIGMWEGGRHWRSLYRVRQPEHEGFTLDGATSDGRFVVYRHAYARVVDLESGVDVPRRQRWLRLPFVSTHRSARRSR